MALLKVAADNVLRTSIELGGKAPAIVFEDADVDLTIEDAVPRGGRAIEGGTPLWGEGRSR